MNKKFWLFLFFILCCPLFTYAGVVSINDTPFAAKGGMRTLGASNTDEPSLDSPSADSENGGGLLYEGESYPSCYFSDCENYSSCQYHNFSSSSEDTVYCNCAADNTNIALCDSQLHYHSTINYSGYARGLGVSADSSLTLIPNQSNYYYFSDVDYFCPVKLADAVSEFTLNPISQSYYSSSRNLTCSSSSTNLTLLGESNNINCIKPGNNYYNNEYFVKLCVYTPGGNNQTDYHNSLDYQLNSHGLQNCNSLRNQRETSSSRNSYSMDGFDDLPSNATSRYYLYRPYADIAPDNADYHISECLIECGISGSSDITPLCQGWYYLQTCSSFTAAEEAAGYYISPLYNSYSEAVAAAPLSASLDICYNTDNAKSTFIRCGLKHSFNATDGVYSETECQSNNGVCSDIEEESYSCGGVNYCKHCVCQSGLVTLNEWCAANNITENCDTDHYIGVGAGCNYDDTSSDLSGTKYTSWTLDPNNLDNLCRSEGQYLALVAFSGTTVNELHNTYGPSAQISRCVSDGTMKWQITCGNEYAFICGIVDTPTDWCVHGRDSSSTMREEAATSSPTKYCQSGTNSGICGMSVMVSNGSGYSMINASDSFKIYQVSSPEQCYNQYGRAASVQSCISTDSNSEMQYNCYYNLSEYIYATTKDNGAVVCSVRHDLTGDYIVYKGQKRWAECNCMSLYNYTVYTCSGNATVTGKACTQDLSNVNSSNTLINKWKNKVPYDAVNNRIMVNSVDLYPYCKCNERFKYTCDDNDRVSPSTGSAYCQIDGRYYYESCQCDIDEIPDHWSNNYFNCSPGAHPTGIWKDDGCGGKMYQCSDTIVCTSEYTQTCNGVGQTGMSGYGCQDDKGDYVLWKRCQCDINSGWHTCLGANQSGVGDACNSGVVDYYQSCACPSGWATCDDNHEIDPSTQSCQTDDGVTVYESCRCNSNYIECTGNGQIGDTTSGMCTLNGGATVYENCICKSDYNRSCLATSNNHIHGDSSDVCTISNSSGATENYYKNCLCDNGYTFTCSNSDHLAPVDANDYCQTNSGATVYYNACQCASGYTETCEGETPADPQDYCELNGTRYYTSCSCEVPSDWTACTGNQIGVGTACVSGGTSYYQSCTCPEGWNICDEDHEIDPSAQTCQTASGVTVYESCNCNSSYERCNGNGQIGNTSLGMCTISGITFYENCVCDSSHNKTCQATLNNHIHGDSSDVCSIIGASGTENYYRNCQCDSGYEYTCSNSDHLVPTDSNNYCQTASGSTLYYTACQCAPGYTETCNSDGQIPADPQDYCELNGTRYYTACSTCDISNGWTTCNNNQIGVGAACVSGGISYYQSCECPSGWTTCTGNGQGVDTTSESCTINETTVYEHCVCNSDYNKTCQATSNNHIHGDSNDVCSITGPSGTENYYRNCLCNSGYSLTCSASDHLVPADTADYCQTASGAPMYYNTCQCASDYTETCTGQTPTDPQDYCELNGTRYYTACDPVLSCQIYDGYAYTQAIVAQLGTSETTYAAVAANQYYPGNISSSDSHFGAGNWYLPAIGELRRLPVVKSTINAALSALSRSDLTNDYYWSSSEVDSNSARVVHINGAGGSSTKFKNNTANVRAVQFCENCFTSPSLSNASSPQVGDVVYSDNGIITYDSYNNSHSDKTPVGIIYWVSSSGTTARIVAIEDIGSMSWSEDGTNITAIPDITSLNGCSMNIPE